MIYQDNNFENLRFLLDKINFLFKILEGKKCFSKKHLQIILMIEDEF